MKPMMSILILVLLNLSGCKTEEKIMAPGTPDHDDRHGVVITRDNTTIEQEKEPLFKIPIM